MNTKPVVAPNRYENVNFTKTVHIDFTSPNGIIIRFIPVNDCPGYTYKVVAISNNIQVASSWLGAGFSVCQKRAEFFYNTLINGVYHH